MAEIKTKPKKFHLATIVKSAHLSPSSIKFKLWCVVICSVLDLVFLGFGLTHHNPFVTTPAALAKGDNYSDTGGMRL